LPRKKPTTGYAFYLKDKRVEFQAANPTLKFGDLSRKIAAAWKALPPESKKEYLDKYEEDKKRYSKAMETYHKPSTESDDSSDESAKKKKKKRKIK
jgi:high mobility group protein B1